MSAFNPKEKMKKYLKQHFIEFYEDVCEGTDRYTMIYKGYDNCPDKILESCIWFYKDSMEVRVYYSQNAAQLCKESKFIQDFLRLLNFINARVWSQSTDGIGGSLYKPCHLHTPRIYMTEDNYYDITLTTVINYDFYEVVPLETENYITACCPELLNKLSPAIFFLLKGEIDINQAILLIEKNILEE